MKTGILIVAHYPLASALRECALHVMPDAVDDLQFLDVQANDSHEKIIERIRIKTQELKASSTFVLTDLIGATPCNAALQASLGHKVKLVCGVNLPMILRVINYRHVDIEDLIKIAVEGGERGIVQLK